MQSKKPLTISSYILPLLSIALGVRLLACYEGTTYTDKGGSEQPWTTSGGFPWGASGAGQAGAPIGLPRIACKQPDDCSLKSFCEGADSDRLTLLARPSCVDGYCSWQDWVTISCPNGCKDGACLSAGAGGAGGAGGAAGEAGMSGEGGTSGEAGVSGDAGTSGEAGAAGEAGAPN